MIEVYVSSVIDAPVEAVWGRVRDFNGMPDWHPAIAASRIEEDWPSDRIGCIRNFSLTNGAVLRERLLTLSDCDYQCTYCIVESPLGLDNYVATLKLTRVTDGNRTFAEWTASFDGPPGEERRLADQVGQDVFQGGFNALKSFFGEGT